MKEEIIQILNVTKDELIQIVKEGVKLELNRQKAIGQTTFNNSHEKYLSRSETAKLLHVTEVTLNNWKRKIYLFRVEWVDVSYTKRLKFWRD